MPVATEDALPESLVEGQTYYISEEDLDRWGLGPVTLHTSPPPAKQDRSAACAEAIGKLATLLVEKKLLTAEEALKIAGVELTDVERI